MSSVGPQIAPKLLAVGLRDPGGTGEAYNAPSDPLAGFKGNYF